MPLKQGKPSADVKFNIQDLVASKGKPKAGAPKPIKPPPPKFKK